MLRLGIVVVLLSLLLTADLQAGFLIPARPTQIRRDRVARSFPLLGRRKRLQGYGPLTRLRRR